MTRFASLRFLVAASLPFLLTVGCGNTVNLASLPKVIVLGVDGMDPSFVERHWDALPNLRALKDHGYFGKLRTTSPPQSPVAWSTFITGLDPDKHGIYDFVHRDPATLALFSSMSKTDDPRFVLPLGPYLLPLSSSKVSSLRHGVPFWRTLADHGIPVRVLRIPANYPPDSSDNNLSGMGTPDLLGTLGTFTYFTDDPMELARSVPGGRVVKTVVSNGRALLAIEGPPNPLRKDHVVTETVMTLDMDQSSGVARIKFGENAILIREGEWSSWLKCEFTLIPHISTVKGMVRVFAKQFRPGLELYVSPINLDPAAAAMPISSPKKWAAEIEADVGPYSTLGIPEDTSALRQGVLTLPEFQQQARFVFTEEAKLLDHALKKFTRGLLFFYFSSVDQNSHILWGRHEDELLKVYREVDKCVGAVRSQQPDAKLIILSDHGFTAFERAVHLNTWLKQHALLTLRDNPNQDVGLDGIDWSSTKAYAVGLNGLYLNLKGRERFGRVQDGEEAKTLLHNLREELLAWRDPLNARAIFTAVTASNPSAVNRSIAPDLIVGYAAGYRASWRTALGQTPQDLIEDNNDAWIGDHCVDPDVVPGVLFSSERIAPKAARLQDVTVSILKRFGLPPPVDYQGQIF